jgi:hypothetical protein
VKVELLYLDGCSNWRLTEERLITALRLANRSHVTVVRRRVDTDEQAAALGFVGSPTVLIDGRDPFVSRVRRGWSSWWRWLLDGRSGRLNGDVTGIDRPLRPSKWTDRRVRRDHAVS